MHGTNSVTPYWLFPGPPKCCIPQYASHSIAYGTEARVPTALALLKLGQVSIAGRLAVSLQAYQLILFDTQYTVLTASLPVRI